MYIYVYMKTHNYSQKIFNNYKIFNDFKKKCRRNLNIFSESQNKLYIYT